MWCACVCMQNRAVESRLTVLCQDISAHRELNAGNIGGPWASLFYPLKQRQNRQELGGGGTTGADFLLQPEPPASGGSSHWSHPVIPHCSD